MRAVESEGTSRVPAEAPEGGAITPAGVVSGAPAEEMHRRPVRIYRPAPPATSSAKTTSHNWRIDWDILQGAGRWENPLMGWASSADYVQGTSLTFTTAEEAIHFCEKQGYPYILQQPNVQKFVPKTYANNYTYTPRKLRIHHSTLHSLFHRKLLRAGSSD
ncbi:hypothetical protein RHOSPDRAFT_20454 [Rhodotorula sp. JG-1b]|nr:hypothetical protein RHOSPDRAFT_20454 [Rhodotorula sp. JG-1b]